MTRQKRVTASEIASLATLLHGEPAWSIKISLRSFLDSRGCYDDGNGGHAASVRKDEQERKRSNRVEDDRFEQARNDARHGVLR